jgi:hypothetical protein
VFDERELAGHFEIRGGRYGCASGRARAKGKESESALAPSILTTLTEGAARRNNEIREVEA